MKWFGPGGACGCCEDTDPCGCDTTPSASYAITLQNWVDTTYCLGCDEFAGTHVLSQIGECVWQKRGTSNPPCDGDRGTGPIYSDDYVIQMSFSNNAGSLLVQISIYYCFGWGYCAGIVYKKQFVGNPDCTKFINQAIPHDSNYSYCTGGDKCNYGITVDDVLLTAL